MQKETYFTVMSDRIWFTQLCVYWGLHDRYRLSYFIFGYPDTQRYTYD